jgi:hypothetical protein
VSGPESWTSTEEGWVGVEELIPRQGSDHEESAKERKLRIAPQISREKLTGDDTPQAVPSSPPFSSSMAKPNSAS